MNIIQKRLKKIAGISLDPQRKDDLQSVFNDGNNGGPGVMDTVGNAVSGAADWFVNDFGKAVYEGATGAYDAITGNNNTNYNNNGYQ